MRRVPFRLAALLCLALALAPAAVQARLGNNGSFGSRGSRTWSTAPGTATAPYGASPLQRSTTPYGGSYGGGYGGYGYNGYGGSALRGGLLGGLLGFGLGGALFGQRGFGHFGVFGLFGFLLRIVLVVFVVRWLMRRFLFARRPGYAGAGFGGLFAPRAASAGGYGAPPSPPLSGPPVAIQPSDYNAFEAILVNIQAAWSRSDLNAIRTLATPEMVGYFADQLADYASRGQRNMVGDVRLQKGDLSEAWSEQGRVYATVAMRFSMTDVTVDTAGRVVDGSPTEHVSATEYWTFVRAGGGHWLLSAIQQTR